MDSNETQEVNPNWAGVMSGIFIMISHALKYYEHYGDLPNHHYLMDKLKISYEVADHVISSASFFRETDNATYRN